MTGKIFAWLRDEKFLFILLFHSFLLFLVAFANGKPLIFLIFFSIAFAQATNTLRSIIIFFSPYVNSKRIKLLKKCDSTQGMLLAYISSRDSLGACNQNGNVHKRKMNHFFHFNINIVWHKSKERTKPLPDCVYNMQSTWNHGIDLIYSQMHSENNAQLQVCECFSLNEDIKI